MLNSPIKARSKILIARQYAFQKHEHDIFQC
jgi:hypothetical protein